jgi:hypothetical protein
MCEENWKNILKELKLEKFIEVFAENGYDDETDWPSLTKEDLREIGLKGGHIKKWEKRYLSSTIVTSPPFPF